MKVHANILDTILNTPTQQSNTGSPKLGDYFMDTEYRGVSKGTGAWAAKTASVLEGDGALAEAFASVSAKHAKTAAARKSTKLGSVKQAVEFVVALDKKVGGQMKNAAIKQQYQAVKAAARRLASLMNKTASQMKQDGATKLADYFDPAVVPAWARQARADFSLIQAFRDKLAPRAKSAALTSSEDVIRERGLSDAEIKGYVSKWLNQGTEPKVIQQKLDKLAALQVFDKSIATQYLNDHAGVLGLAYLEPNHYMNDCESTAERMDTKLGGVRAKSVKQITACKGCVHFKKSSGMKTCSLYRLPIVASNSDLMPIINNLTAGAKDKKAALVARANREHLKIEQPKTASTQFSRSGAKGRVLVNKGADIDGKKKTAAATEFSAKTVLAMHNSGESLNKIFAHGSKVAGPARAKKACRQFIKELKGTQTKVALTQIDCTMLPSKLSSSNAIYGERKCATCTYRKGMHCGLTGGTLVTFPGIEKGSSSRVASSAKDGLALAREFDLTHATKPADIEMSKPRANDVEMSSTSQMDF